MSPGRRGVLLYTDDGVFFPLPSAGAPDVVEKEKEKIKEEALKEHRRLLYVALTRPRDRLHICGFEGRRGVQDGSWYPLMQRAARKIGTAATDAEETAYFVGAADIGNTAVADAEKEPIILPEWIRGLPSEESERPRLIRPSRPAVSDERGGVSPSGDKARFERGLIIHALLARLPDLATDKRREAAHAFLTRRGVEDASAHALVEETMGVLENPEFAAVFAQDARAEIAIVADLPELGKDARVSGRLDRLAVESNAVLAIDFKTNRPAPGRLEDVPQLYLTQMALYRAALSKIFAGRRISCALVWTQVPCLMALPQELLDAETGRIRARLDPWG